MESLPLAATGRQGGDPLSSGRNIIRWQPRPSPVPTREANEAKQKNAATRLRHGRGILQLAEVSRELEKIGEFHFPVAIEVPLGQPRLHDRQKSFVWLLKRRAIAHLYRFGVLDRDSQPVLVSQRFRLTCVHPRIPLRSSERPAHNRLYARLR